MMQSPDIILAVGQCMAHGVGPIHFDSFDIAVAFLRTLAGDTPVNAMVDLVRDLVGADGAKSMAKLLHVCMGVPV
jgi:hypothetical protein